MIPIEIEENREESLLGAFSGDESISESDIFAELNYISIEELFTKSREPDWTEPVYSNEDLLYKALKPSAIMVLKRYERLRPHFLNSPNELRTLDFLATNSIRSASLYPEDEDVIMAPVQSLRLAIWYLNNELDSVDDDDVPF